MNKSTNVYQIIKVHDELYRVVKVVSEHKTQKEANENMFKIMKEESQNELNKLVEESNNKGIPAVTVEEAIKDMSPEQLERFKEERNRKFIKPLLNKNSKELEVKKRRVKIKCIK